MWQQVWEFLQVQLQQNELLAGGAVLAALGILLNYVRRVPALLITWGRYLFVTEMNIPDRSNSFRWVREWLAQHTYARRAKRVSVEEAGKGDTQYTPSPGWHLIWWGWTPIIVIRRRKEGTGDHAARAFRETFVVMVVGNRAKANKFIQECYQTASYKQLRSLRVKHGDSAGWGDDQYQPKRELASVILDGDSVPYLMQDITTFLQSKAWYQTMGIPWRRGYLLTGPPGNGKSSLVAAVASHFDLPIHITSLTNMDDDGLSWLLRVVPEKSILLLEDADCLFTATTETAKVSLSVLLNNLDGLVAAEGRLLFMTTNHVRRLPPALIRPGRIDEIFNLANATPVQAARLFARFFETHAHLSEEFGQVVRNQEISMATLQGHLLKWKDDPEQAFTHRKDIVDATSQTV